MSNYHRKVYKTREECIRETGWPVGYITYTKEERREMRKKRKKRK